MHMSACATAFAAASATTSPAALDALLLGILPPGLCIGMVCPEWAPQLYRLRLDLRVELLLLLLDGLCGLVLCCLFFLQRCKLSFELLLFEVAQPGPLVHFARPIWAELAEAILGGRGAYTCWGGP